MHACPCANLERTAHRCRQYPAVSLSPASSGGCPMAESAFDWRLVVAGLAVAAVGAALVAWQTRGDPARCRGWLGWSALSLELLAAAMAVFWAVRNGSNVLTLLFAVGFIGLALAKAVTISALVHAGRAGNYGAVAVGVLAMAGAYLTVYGAGAFEGTMDGSQKAAEAAQRSAPALAMDSQLKAAYAKLEGLTAYADSTRAAESASKAENLHRRLQDARNRLAACPPTYITKCVDPARREIASLEQALGADGYAAGNAAYLGTQQHIADLEAQRAELLKTGGTAAGVAAGRDDELVAWLFGVPVPQAAALKWLLFVGVFDVLSLLLRLLVPPNKGTKSPTRGGILCCSKNAKIQAKPGSVCFGIRFWNKKISNKISTSSSNQREHRKRPFSGQGIPRMPRLKAIPKTDAAWNIRFRGMLEYLKASYSYDVTKSCGTFGSFVGRNPPVW